MVLAKASQSLAKLEIQPLNPLTMAPSGGSIKVAFNPNSYSIRKSVSWKTPDSSTGRGETQELLNAPKLTFGGGSSRTLVINELFFDVTEPGSAKDVREKTNKIVALTRIDRTFKQPPACRVSWGKAPSGSDFPFDGVITDLLQTFTLFKKDGTPVRAMLSITFKEYIKPKDDQRKTDPELTTYTVKRGDNLSSIAGKLYGNPTRWRLIAEANSLDDPRKLEIGKVLTIPETD